VSPALVSHLYRSWKNIHKKSNFNRDRLLSRIAAWDNGYKGVGYQYSNEPPERDPDMMSIASLQSRVSLQSRRY
jgi:hypothetical protein